MQLQNAHETQEITALTFDPEQRRLFSGARDGTIKVRPPPPLLSSISLVQQPLSWTNARGFQVVFLLGVERSKRSFSVRI